MWLQGIADKFTQYAQGRLLWPGMTIERSDPNNTRTHSAPHLRTASVAPSGVASKTGEASTAWI
jgi:hypothetical protein